MYTYTSGAKYEGQWNDNLKSGAGIYTFAKGGSYTGNFVNGAFEGRGVRFLRSGAIKAGKWSRGEFTEADKDTTACDGAVNAAAAAAAEARKAGEASQDLGIKEKLAKKLLTFPPLVALAVSTALSVTGITLPSAVRW